MPDGVNQVLSAVFLLVTSPVVAPRQVSGGPAIDPGALQVVGADGKLGGVCPLEKTSVQARIEGFGARVIVVQKFKNPNPKAIEAIYTFPLPQDAAVDGMRMVIGNRIINGVIKKKEEARQTYENAKKEGKTAALLDQQRPNVFTQSVANIPPGAEVQVALTYVQLLKFEKSQFEFVYPMVVAPRYVGEGVADGQKVNPPVVPQGTRSGTNVEMTIELDAGAPILSMESVLHRIDTEKFDPQRMRIHLAKRDEIPNRDFILKYSIAGPSITGALLTHTDPKKGGFFSLILMPPKTPSSDQVAPKESIFVMDQSGSQDGLAIEKSKQLTKKLIEALNPNDTFNVVSFSTEYKILWPVSRPNTAANRLEASKYVSGLKANGGTDIFNAVLASLNLKVDLQRPRIVVVNTDGLIGGEAETLKGIAKHRGNARVFTFGIGNSVNRYLIEAMSLEGRGDHEILSLGSSSEGNVDEAVDRLVQRTDSPVLTDIQIRFEGVAVEEVLPRYIPDVFSEKPVIVKGRYRRAGNGTLVVSGNLGGKPWTARYPVTFPSQGNAGSAIGSLWAREKVSDLEARERIDSMWSENRDKFDAKKYEDAITKLALEFAIMTRFTSFVAVDERVSNPGGNQETVEVPVDMADGMTYEGLFGTMAGKPDSRLQPPASTPAFRPGDPLLSVDAPRDASVVAVFPGGDLKELAWNESRSKWEVRFDIPISFTEGIYNVTVHIRTVDGVRSTLTVPFEVSMTAPTLNPKSQLIGGKLEVALTSDPRWGRVLLLTPWGDRLELEYDAARGVICKALDLPKDFAGDWFTLIGFDRAFNQRVVRIHVNASGTIDKVETQP